MYGRLNIWICNIFFQLSDRSEHCGLAQMEGRWNVQEQGQAGLQNSPDYRGQHWHWEGDSHGHGPQR